MKPIPDPDRRLRWIEGAAAAMVCSGTIGLAHFLAVMTPWRWDLLERAVMETSGATTLSFWTFFLMVYFFHIRKSAATLEYEREARRGATARAPAAPTGTARRSPPG